MNRMGETMSHIANSYTVKRWMQDRKAFAQGFGDGDADGKLSSWNRQLSVASPLARAMPVC